MSKIFNAQNLSNHKEGGREYLIYFTSPKGEYTLYRYDKNSGTVEVASRVSELLEAEKIYVSYSYLGGIHLSNYTCTKTVNGDQTVFLFILQKVTSTLSNNLKYWDIPNAAFISRSVISPNLSSRGLEPIKYFTITFIKDIWIDTSFTTFGDETQTQHHKNWITAYGSWSHSVQGKTINENLIVIQDLSTQQITERQHTVMISLERDMGSSNPTDLSFSKGMFSGNRFIPRPVNLIAGLCCFEYHSEKNYFCNLYLITPSESSFNINAINLKAKASKIQLLSDIDNPVPQNLTFHNDIDISKYLNLDIY